MSYIIDNKVKLDYEWTPRRRKNNFFKHGIDFQDAINVFLDKDRVERSVCRNRDLRYETIGMVSNVIILLVYTIIEQKICIISARKCFKDEQHYYQEKAF